MLCKTRKILKFKRNLFNVITYYVKSGTRIAKQANICVYKAYTFIKII